MSQLSPEEWTDFWNNGSITTFGAKFKDGYDGEFLDFWKLHIEDKHKQLIDLCCGNGALSWMAQDLFKTKPIPGGKITAVDIADINPFQLLNRNQDQYPDIHFLGNTSIDKLPLADNSLDMAISQYGLEYADLDKAIPELGRVLKSSSRIALIMHYTESALLQTMRISSEKFTYLLNSGYLPETVLALDDIFNSKETFPQAMADPAAQKYFYQVKMATDRITNMHSDIDDSPQLAMSMSYINHMMDTFKKGKTKDPERRKTLEFVLHNMELAVSRNADLQAAALSEPEYQHLIELLQREGFTIKDRGTINYEVNFNFGWKLVAERS